MSNVPFYYDYMNRVTSSVQPNVVHVRESGLSQFFQRSLLQKAMGVFKFILPEEWPENFFLYSLFCNGFVGIVETDKYGVIPQICTLSGYDVFYQPSRIMVSNPLIRNTLQPRIGTECALIKLQPDYGGVMDTVTVYADLLALAAQAMGVNMLNSKLSYVFVSGTKAGGETAKKLYDNVASGMPAVVVDAAAFKEMGGELKWELFEQHVKQNFIAPDLVNVMNALEDRFCTEVGLNNVGSQKMERMVVDEVNANNEETKSRASLWLDQLKAGCDQANNLFGLSLSVDFRNKPKGGGADVHETVDSGIV